MAPGNADMYRARSQHQADVILVSGVRDPMKTATSVDDLAPWAVGLLDAPASPEELLRAYAWLSSH